MKPSQDNSASEPLRGTLQAWQVTAPLPPRFQQQVWERIERARTESVPAWKLWRAWLAEAFARPAMATAYVAVLLALGLSAGFWTADKRVETAQDELASRYVQTVDPYQALRP